jgi:hypothetical protein
LRCSVETLEQVELRWTCIMAGACPGHLRL